MRIHAVDLTVQTTPAPGATHKSLITVCSTLSMDSHILRLSIDIPALPHHHIMRDVEQPSSASRGSTSGPSSPTLGLSTSAIVSVSVSSPSLASSRFGPLSKR